MTGAPPEETIHNATQHSTSATEKNEKKKLKRTFLLTNHPIAGAGGLVIGARRDLFPEPLHRFPNRAHGQRVAAGVQARRATDLGDAQRATELVEHFDFEVDGSEHSLPALIRADLLEFAGELQQRNIVAPLAPSADLFNLLQPLAQSPQAFGKLHLRPIKGKPAALPLSFTFQRPLDQTVGTEQRKGLQRFGRQNLGLYPLAKALDPSGLLIDGRFEAASPIEKFVGEGMFA